jgi:hypothetical protein
MAETDVIRTPDQRLRVFVSSTLLGPDEDPDHICGMDQAGQEIGAAIEELRELAHGIYPVLTDEGLAAAVEALCERAAQPTNRDDFDERRRHRSHGTSCSFPITVTFQAKHVGTAFFDAQGNFQRATVETNAVGTNSANGITLRETDHVVDFYNSTGYVKETGLPIHVQDGGVVIRDAGYLLFNPDGTVALIHGPHPQLEGDTAAVCAALS